MSTKAEFFIGTSGWSYDHWQELFYPESCPKSRRFEYYATKFSSVEVNATFYRRFQDSTYEKWYSKAPASFKYILKMPKLITHRKYLHGVGEQINDFEHSAAILKEKFGCMLMQLPPGFHFHPERLHEALGLFTHSENVAVEFRHKSWYNEETLKILQQYGAAFCNIDSPEHELNDYVTAKSTYIRLHGKSQWYCHDYSDEELGEVADISHRLIEQGAERIFIFFNNDFGGFAPENALKLEEILKERSLMDTAG